MEPADIDWKRAVSRYVRDEAYEDINAPRWADLTSPDPYVDDDAWFCRPDCQHPKTAEDFLKLTPSPKSKLQRSASAVLTSNERNTNNTTIRDGNNLKRRGGGIGAFLSAAGSPKPKVTVAKKKFQDDSENQDPEMSTQPLPPAVSKPPFGTSLWAKNAKAAVKSSAEKRPDDEKEALLEKNALPPPKQLRSTLSARNLFSGKDILGQISEFYNELKRMAGGRNSHGSLVAVEEVKEQATMDQKSPSPMKQSNGIENKARKMALRVDTRKERSPSVLKEVKASPPTPQRIPSPSASRIKNVKAGNMTASSPLKKPAKSTPEKGIHNRDVENSREAKTKRQPFAKKDINNSRAGDAEGNAGSSMLWFLKPCTFLVD